jgi:NAD(P)-dependent dehydrogenase (short-subunit alcohol dehydrogenase family)
VKVDLAGRTALVTGSTSGIGRAIAEGLARSGARVVVNGRDAARTEAAARAIAEAAGAGAAERVVAAAADVGTAAGADALLAAAPDVDVLVNNAGIFEPTPVFEIPDDEWLRSFEVNGMSKTAQIAVARGMAGAVSGTGVRINSVLPGPTLTEGVREMLASQGVDAADIGEAGRRYVREERPTSLLGRLIDTEEVANAVVYLASEQASATTGAAFRVDGGVVRAIA